MAFNGSGLFLINSSGQPVQSGTLISAAVFNAFTADIANGLSTTVTTDGQSTIAANIPMSGFVFTGLGAGATDGQSLRYQQLFTTDPVQLLGSLEMVRGADIASSSTLDLTGATGNGVHVTGTTDITAVTLGSGMWRIVVFDGILTLTHDATDNNLPYGANITTAAGDRALYWADGTTVYCVAYNCATKAGQLAILGAASLAGPTFTGIVKLAESSSIASASTVNLASATGNTVHITGNTGPITSFGTLPAGTIMHLIFDSTPTITYNSSSMITVSAADITAVANDTAIIVSEGSGNWRFIDYERATGLPLLGFASTGETQAGSIVNKGVTPGGLKASIGFSNFFESSEQSLSNSATISVSHGLGGVPKLFQVVIRCKTAELGYSIGDEVEAITFDTQDAYPSNFVNATTIGVVTNAAAAAVTNRSSFGRNAVTNADWKFVFRAWI